MGASKRAVIAMIGLLVAACAGEDETPVAASVRPAKLLTVEQATSRRDVSFPAVIRAAQSAELTFQVAGEVVELNVFESQDVEKGAVIARLDQRNARNSLASAQAELDNAESEYQRAVRLAEQDAISRSTVESRKTQRDVAAVALSQAQQALGDTVIRAPFAGAISQVSIEQYQNVQAKEAIATLQSSETEALINIPGTIIARIPQLQPVESVVVLDAAPDQTIQAQFREASGVADPNTQTYEISFTFIPPEGLLILPGMTATVRTTFLFSGSDDIVAKGIGVPLAAILAEGDQRFVWVVDTETMVIAKREVQVGPEVAKNATVTSGLNGGETIVAAGVAFLSEGTKVRAWSAE
ncbi:MAG: efflux RND transporter periplasmic adaptor subunit [Pseudomonadota bacterium]